MSHQNALYVRIPEGVSREQVFQRVRELLAETSRHDQEVRLYRVAPWVEVLSPHSEALWQTVNRVSREGPCEAVGLSVQPGADTLYYRRDVGGQLARELKYSREWLSTSGQPEPWEAEVFTEGGAPGPAPVWTRDAQQGERRWEDVPPVSTARAFGIITRALGLPAGEGLSPGDGIQESVVLPALRGGVEYKWDEPVSSGPVSRRAWLGMAAILAAFLWLVVGGMKPVHGAACAAVPLAWGGYILLLWRYSRLLALGGGFVATCVTVVAALTVSRLLD